MKTDDLDPVTVVRGNLGYGKKPSKRGLAAIAAERPVDIHHYNEQDDTFTIQTIHDPNPIVEMNKADYLSGHDGYTKSRNLRRVASIPMGVVDMLYKMGINVFDGNDWPKVAAMLDDPAWQFLRTAPGRISRRPVRKIPGEGWLKR